MAELRYFRARAFFSSDVSLNKPMSLQQMNMCKEVPLYARQELYKKKAFAKKTNVRYDICAIQTQSLLLITKECNFYTTKD